MIPLFKHQEAAAQFITARGGSGAVYHEIGLGKTRTALEIFGRLRDKNPGIKMMVVCPISLIEGAWGEDIRKYSQFQYVNCHDQGIDYVKDIDIYIMNYEMLLSPKNLMAIRKMLIINFMCVLDESSKIKTTRTRPLRRFFPCAVFLSIASSCPESRRQMWSRSIGRRLVSCRAVYSMTTFFRSAVTISTWSGSVMAAKSSPWGRWRQRICTRKCLRWGGITR